MTSRRDFVKRAAGAGIGAAAVGAFPFEPGLHAEVAAARTLAGAPAVHRARVTPIAVASGNGQEAVSRAIEILRAGGDTLEAVVRGVNIVEEDPSDMTVGYGGLPNEDGVVQLDASVMHGPTRGAGAVAALEGIRTPSLVAAAVMRYTDHVMLVGDGARRFARALGFQADEDLLTEASRARWLELRAQLSEDDDWLSPAQSGEPVDVFTREPGRPGRDTGGSPRAPSNSWDGVRPMGTIHCSAVDPMGDMSGVTTTSGLFYKLPGRVGDSPIIGAGLYTDNDVGSAGATGRGEAVIKTCGSHSVVEAMRAGSSPKDACLEACRRIVRWTVERRLLDEDGRPNFNVVFYAVNKRGEHGSAAIWSGGRYAVSVDGETSLQDVAYVFQRD
ncbi:MAG TPA: N(4)-(beta-N-acetylglucosaminyl)-L-asparaginase [Longimicrobiales bacterium]|nr:N(4)-(beta-N-acetylglucosaminyl)-L-asparaginase [Longimicrobiales bacterium]